MEYLVHNTATRGSPVTNHLATDSGLLILETPSIGGVCVLGVGAALLQSALAQATGENGQWAVGATEMEYLGCWLDCLRSSHGQQLL